MNEETFEDRVKKFKKSVRRAEKKYGVELTFGWIHSWDDDQPIIQDKKEPELMEYLFDD